MFSAARDRSGWFALGLLTGVSPLLAFPRSIAPEQPWIAASAGVLSMVVAVSLLRAPGRMAWWVGGLTLFAIVGWWRVVDTPSTLDHFCGLALGLLSMATITAWCTTRARLALVTCAILLFGVVALAVGVRSSQPVHAEKAFSNNPLAVRTQSVPLPLPGLYSRKDVSPNALGATAMMILPIAVAVAATLNQGVRFAWLLRVVGSVTAVWAIIILAVAQSRSAWLATACILLLLARGRLSAHRWWLAVIILGAVFSLSVWLMAPTHPLLSSAATVLQLRMDIWMAAIAGWQSSPWFGIGLDYFRQSAFAHALPAPHIVEQLGHAHNMFLQTALDVGTLGLVCYLVVQGWLVICAAAIYERCSDRWLRYVAAGAALSLVSVHLFGMLDAVALGTKIGLLQWLASGLILVIYRRSTLSHSPSLTGGSTQSESAGAPEFEITS